MFIFNHSLVILQLYTSHSIVIIHSIIINSNNLLYYLNLTLTYTTHMHTHITTLYFGLHFGDGQSKILTVRISRYVVIDTLYIWTTCVAPIISKWFTPGRRVCHVVKTCCSMSSLKYCVVHQNILLPGTHWGRPVQPVIQQ